MVLEAIKYTRGDLTILDQLQLPHITHYDPITSANDAWAAIHHMRVRGAPAIAIVAALGLAVEITDLHFSASQVHSQEFVRDFIHERLDYLVTSRPTAVNLGTAARELKEVAEQAVAGKRDVRDAYIAAAELMLEHDVADNEGIGRHGAAWITDPSKVPAAANGASVSIITHCNTGSLATAGYGTALGVIRSVHAAGKLKHAFCTETRPYNQGSRLTAFELVHDKIPATLVTDSMAGALMRLNRGGVVKKGEDMNVVAVVVGADRVAANGDAANKIGTYGLAVLARYHGVKFLVAAPRTTIDMATPSGESIKIEERPGREMTTIRGPAVVGVGSEGFVEVDLERKAELVSIAAQGIEVWNPAFDVTPRELIDGIVTEVGVMEKDEEGRFHLEKIMPKGSRQTGGGKVGESSSGMFPDKPW